MRKILKIAPLLNYYKEYTAATTPLTITTHLLKNIFIWLGDFLSNACVSMVFLQLMHLQWSSRSKKIVVTMKSCRCLIMLSQNFLLSYDVDDEDVEFIY